MKPFFLLLSLCYLCLLTSVSAQDENHLTIYGQTVSLHNGSEQLVIDLIHNDELIHTFDGMWGSFWLDTYDLPDKGVAIIIDIFARDAYQENKNTNQEHQSYLLFITTNGRVQLFDEHAFVGANEFSVQNGQLIGTLTPDDSKPIAFEFDGEQLLIGKNVFSQKYTKTIKQPKKPSLKSRDFFIAYKCFKNQTMLSANTGCFVTNKF